MTKKSPPTIDLKRDARGWFLPGGPPGPGRPKGSRNRLSESFLHDLHSFWEEQGPAVIRRAARQSPSAFIRSMTILLRPTTRFPDEDEHSEFDDLQTVEEVVEATRQSLGEDVARTLVDLVEGKKGRRPPRLAKR